MDLITAAKREIFRDQLEYFFDLVRSGEFTAEEVYSQLVRTFPAELYFSPEIIRFKQNSRLIYEDEVVLDHPMSYPLRNGEIYEIRMASENDINSMFKLYQHLSGEDYDSPEALRDIMRKALQGKRILEAGCGPGFNLKVLSDLGAIVSGVDIRGQFQGMVPEADVRFGTADSLAYSFGREQFDVIYSRDLLAKAVLDEPTAARVVEETYNHTKQEGIGVHSIYYVEVPIPIHLFGIWMNFRKLGVPESFYDEHEAKFWESSDEEMHKQLVTNNPLLTQQQWEDIGYTVKEHGPENTEFTVVVEK